MPQRFVIVQPPKPAPTSRPFYDTLEEAQAALKALQAAPDAPADLVLIAVEAPDPRVIDAARAPLPAADATGSPVPTTP